jgi:hypothetical protein
MMQVTGTPLTWASTQTWITVSKKVPCVSASQQTDPSHRPVPDSGREDAGV